MLTARSFPWRCPGSWSFPRIDQLRRQGIEGIARPAPVDAASVEFAGRRFLARVVAYGDEAIIGRDLLNRVAALLDGPQRLLSIRRAR